MSIAEVIRLVMLKNPAIAAMSQMSRSEKPTFRSPSRSLSSTVHGSMHGPGFSGGASLTAGYTLTGGAAFADAFHVFAVEWEPAVVRFYVDGSLYETRTPADLKAGQAWVFDHPFFILLNVAVGGDWPGRPDATSVFPQTMLVDYVRVYR